MERREKIVWWYSFRCVRNDMQAKEEADRAAAEKQRKQEEEQKRLASMSDVWSSSLPASFPLPSFILRLPPRLQHLIHHL